MRIGMLDWGIGGLSVYNELKRQLPHVDCMYISDSGAVPYGKMTKKQLLCRLQKISSFFKENNVDKIIIACNAASTVAQELAKKNEIQFFEILSAGFELIKKTNKKNILILGGNRTIRSKYFQKKISDLNRKRKSKIKYYGRIAQPLSAFIECGDLNSVLFEGALRSTLKVKQFSPDLVLLACTHYPAIKNNIQNYFPKAELVDPAQQLINKIITEVYFEKRSKKNNSLDVFFTTGDVVKTKTSALKAFNVKISKVVKLEI